MPLLVVGYGALPPAAPEFMAVASPVPGAQIRFGGVSVLVRFTPGQRVADATFRALLNGADVTEELLTGHNGAYGELHGLLDGVNVLRLEVFGRGPWPGSRLYEQSREIHVLYHSPQGLDRG